MKDDHRKKDEVVRTSNRKRAIELIKSGKKKQDVAALFGVVPNTITNWVKRHNAGGSKALADLKRGAKSANRKLLNQEQEQQLIKMLTDKNPEQYKLPYALWTRGAVAELIEHQFGVTIATNTAGDYLRSWGFTPQKPLKRAYEQSPKAVQRWLDEEYPLIQERVRQENGEIYWGDETGARNYNNHGRSYAPKGKTPVRSCMAARFSVNMISAITNRGKVQFMIYSENMNADRLIEFFEQLIKGANGKIFLILDNLKVHHCKIVKAWLLEHQSKIELFYLPSYSPELNPDELLNCDLKGALSYQPAPKNKEQLTTQIGNHLIMLQQNPARVASYFKHSAVGYAA